MKYPAFILFSLLLCVSSAFAQADNKQKEPVSLIELSKQPVCGTQHIAYLNETVKAQPSNPEFQLQYAYCLKITKNADLLKVVSVIINLNPKFSSYLYSDLSSLLLSNDLQESEVYLNKLSGVLPNHWFLYAVQTRLKVKQKNYQGAFDNWLKAIALMPLTERNDTLKQITLDIHGLMKEKDALDFYDRIYNAMHKRHQNLTLKLNEQSVNSPEYKEVQSEISKISNVELMICSYWANFAAKLGDIKMESAVLEKMVAIEPRWIGYLHRSTYFQRNGNPQKAFADKIRAYEVLIQSLNDELKQGGTQEQQLNLNNRIADQFTFIGDLYFLDAQYVKAISNYEKAKSLSRYPTAIAIKINLALRKLNVTEEKPKIQANPSPIVHF